MIACVDTHYTKGGSRTGVVLFKCWRDDRAEAECVNEQHHESAEYMPGQFFQRELPCIIAAIEPFLANIEIVVVDGYVQLGNGRAGLGFNLYEALECVVVVGVAKNPFQGEEDAICVFHGGSERPLFVTAAGIPADKAAKLIGDMHGPFRNPTLLKRVDRLARGT